MLPNKRALYCIIKSPGIKKGLGTQLALHVQLWPGSDGEPETLCFYDTNRGHMFPGKMTEIQDHTFTFTDKRGDIWEFREVTIQEFRHRLAPHVDNGENIAKVIKTTEDLWEWYRKTFPI